MLMSSFPRGLWTLTSILTTAVATPLSAQLPASPQTVGIKAPSHDNESWADMQRSQAFATARLARSPLRHAWVSIKQGGRVLRAFVTYPDRPGPTPVVIVTHEVFGLTDSTLNTADEIAGLGYITIAPDMLSGFGPGGGNTDSFALSRTTGGFMTVLPDETVNSAFDVIADYGLRLPGANGKLALVGLSWGGGASFRYAASARHDRRLKLVAAFYDVGPPAVTQGPFRFADDNPPLSVEAVDVPVYGFYPSKDARAMNSVPATSTAMAAAGKTFDPVVYKGADHAFMRVGEDPSNGNPANAAAVKASLERLKRILAGM